MENDLRISTITSVLKLSHIIDLEKIYKQLPISKRYIPYIEYGCNNIPRGFSEKVAQNPFIKCHNALLYEKWSSLPQK